MDLILGTLSTVTDIDKIFKVLRLGLVFSVIVNVIIVLLLFKLTDIFIKKLKKNIQKTETLQPSTPLFLALERTIKSLILFFVVASLLQSNGYSITSLIAGFGITGLAIGFAAQQTITNFFGAVTITIDKIYRIGDYVKIGETEGTVESVNLLSTKIRTPDDFLIMVPNNNVSSSVITNITRARKRRINEVFTLTYDTTCDKLTQAMEIIKTVCENNTQIYKNPSVFIETLNSSSIDVRLWAYAKTDKLNEFAQIKSNLILEIVKKFNEENINFAFPSQSIYIEKK